ncbi:MAG: alkaline phosphatase family protein, partial [Planctomycetota bacterium]|nr:alkaline phosphatase family protein [Planctomycetota bacterium]
MAVRRAAKVLLLGWDAADWQLLSPLIDAGRLPCLARLVEQGTKADFASGFPLLSPLAWNSIATGHEAHRHGILGFTEPDPQTGRLRPVGSTARRVKALWNILSQQGFRTHVVGWNASHPAEQIQGVCVSDQFANAPTTPGVPWPVPPGAVQPESLTETFTELRLRPEDLPLDQIRAFIPRVREIDPRKDSRPGLLAVALAKCATQHAIATWLLEHEEWDFLAVQYNLLDHLGHLFMPFHPPRREGIPEPDYELYSGVMTTACQFLDMTLHRLLQLAGPDPTVILCSEHGFFCGADRPAGIRQAADPGRGGSRQGRHLGRRSPVGRDQRGVRLGG